MKYYIVSNELYHHGVKGMKWGIRRYQNEDGSLTPKGMKRYGIEGIKSKKYKRDRNVAKFKEQYRKEIEKQKAQKQNAKNAYLKDKTGLKKAIHEEAFNYGYNRSVGSIIANTILTTIGQGLIVSAGVGALVNNGEDAAAQALSRVGGLTIAATTAIGVTAAIQRGRKKF